MSMQLGFIGGGNMAGALMGGILGAGVLSPSKVHVYDISGPCLEGLRRKFGVQTYGDPGEMLGRSDLVVLAVKPNVAAGVLQELGDGLAGKGLISIVTGWTTDMLRKALGDETRLLRVMPNTPALCGEGMCALSRSCTLTEAEREFAQGMFAALGRWLWVPEELMEAVVGVSGSGPAYGYLFIEALADAGVEMGLARDQAVLMAAQTLKGAAEMVLATGQHPGALKDAVCSPGGTTIRGVRALEERGFRAAVKGGALAAWERARELKA